MTKQIRIVVAEDHELVRAGVRAMLDGVEGMSVVGEAADGAAAVRLTAELAPDVVVMDVAMPGLDGVTATRQILAAAAAAGKVAAGTAAPGAAAPAVLVLSAFSARPLIAELFRAGATGYVPKEAAMDDLVAGVREVAAGRVYVSPSAARAILETLSGGEGGGPPRPRLTDREREVLRLTADGRATKEAARDLGVSVKTIETHKRNVMEKLDLHSVAELTKYAIREGMVTV